MGYLKKAVVLLVFFGLLEHCEGQHQMSGGGYRLAQTG